VMSFKIEYMIINTRADLCPAPFEKKREGENKRLRPREIEGEGMSSCGVYILIKHLSTHWFNFLHNADKLIYL